MAPSRYEATTPDGRRFTITAGSDSGAVAAARAHHTRVSKLTRCARAGRTVDVPIARYARETRRSWAT